MEALTFVLNPNKQSPSVQLWLEDHECGGEDEIMTNYYHSEGMVYCHLIVDFEYYAIRMLPYPEVFHFLESRFNWGNANWFPLAFGQVFELTGKQGEKLWIANSLNVDMNELRME